jgi:ferredoxin-NADP reductase
MTLTFLGAEKREADITTFRFKPEQPVAWRAGQFLHYTLSHDNPDERGIKRWFTIAAPPSSGEVRITTRIVEDQRRSTFKEALRVMKPGDTIEAEAPEGDFVVEDAERNMIWVAGGIGITPYYAILAEADATGQQLKAHLLYANRTEDVLFRDEFTKFQERNPHLKIDYIIDPEKIDEARLKQAIDDASDPLVYVSGPEPMVEAMVAQLEDSGFSKENIKGDYFPGYRIDLA